MFQTFEPTTTPETGPTRLSDLRAQLRVEKLDGFLIPRADAHMEENVAPRDERLAWLTGFTGSAGLCIALQTRAALLVDGRYTLQARTQSHADVFEVHFSADISAEGWILDALPKGGVIGFDPWLHSDQDISTMTEALEAAGITLRAVENLVDRIWTDQPPAPQGQITVQPAELTGEDHSSKRERLGQDLQQKGAAAALLTQPDAIAWLLNIRGSDIARTPLPQGFALLHSDGRVTLYGMEQKIDAAVMAHLGNHVDVQPLTALEPALRSFAGQIVAADRKAAPIKLLTTLRTAGAELIWHQPVTLPKARKTQAEIDGARAAHIRDAVAYARFLEWFDRTAPEGGLTEIDVVTQLEGFRAATGALKDISFETICGAGPNGAIVHYRVTTETNRAIVPGDIVLVDSGGQYQNGTTDITRTLPTGPVDAEIKQAFTRVLKGMIAVTCARFPAGTTGRDLDTLARMPLWEVGLDYAHGTGHGVGSYLGVHEGPQSISRRGTTPLEPGMIISNEPGYYREGHFGIRIENLCVTTSADIPQGGEIAVMRFDTVTLAPIDTRMIDATLLTSQERNWLNAYHAHIVEQIAHAVQEDVRHWLHQACAPV